MPSALEAPIRHLPAASVLGQAHAAPQMPLGVRPPPSPGLVGTPPPHLQSHDLEAARAVAARESGETVFFMFIPRHHPRNTELCPILQTYQHHPWLFGLNELCLAEH